MRGRNPYRAAGTFSGEGYIEREADRLLVRAIERNKRFPYMLAPRQSGKSSLIRHTMETLDAQTYKSVLVDLSVFRPEALHDYDAFLDGFFSDCLKGLGVERPEPTSGTFLERLRSVLERCRRQLILFIDEVDVLLRSGFKDTLFSAIRNIFNERGVRASGFVRVQFVIAGAAKPAELISDPYRSPFNVGESIEMEDFTPVEVERLAAGLRDAGVLVSADIPAALYRQAGGSVYLSQLILERLWEESVIHPEGSLTAGKVDAIVDRIVASAANDLHFINIYQQFKLDVRAGDALLRLMRNQPVNDDDRGILLHTGLGGKLSPYRNRIYDRVFGAGGPLEVVPQSGTSQLPAQRNPFSLGRSPVPVNAKLFVGRDAELQRLNEIWESRSLHVVQLVGSGGMGKSTLIWQWLESMKSRGYPGVSQAFDWTFYSQGQHEYVVDSEKFLQTAALHFGLVRRDSSSRQLADAISESFLAAGGLLVLDGVEPLQHPPDIMDGSLLDPGLIALLRQIRTAPPPKLSGPNRLLIVTTRWSIPDLKGSGVETLNLGPLSARAGAALLRNFGFHGDPAGRIWFLGADLSNESQRAQEEFEAVSREYGGHPLALTLLASYLVRYCGGDLDKRRLVLRDTASFGDAPYRHARRVLASYYRMFVESDDPLMRSCRQVLCLVGLFERPAPLHLLKSVLRGQALPGLTDDLTDARFDMAISELRRLHLLAVDPASDRTLDAHPLVREHFSQVLLQEAPEAARLAYDRIYEYLRDAAPFLPNTLEESDLLLQSVIYGCKAGRYSEALHDVYITRLMRGEERYVTHFPRANRLLLPVLSHFFESGDWSRPASTHTAGLQGLNENDQLYVLLEAGMYLVEEKGYAANEVEQVYEQTAKLGLASTRHHIRYLMEQWATNLARARSSRSASLAQEVLNLAGEQKEDAALLEGHLAVGVTSLYFGDLASSNVHLSRALALYELDQRNSTDFSLSYEPGVACRAAFAFAQYLEGCADTARTETRRTLDQAGNGGHPHTLALALYMAALVHSLLRDIETAKGHVSALLEISRSCGFSSFLGRGVILRGWMNVETGDLERGIEDLQKGLSDYQATGSRLACDLYLSLLADAHHRNGRVREGQHVLREALDLTIAQPGSFWTAELHRLMGVFTQARDPLNVTDAEVHYRRALDVARKQGAMSLELRAAMSLGRLSLHQSNQGEAKELLTEIYGRFTQGRDTPDLKECQMLINQLTEAVKKRNILQIGSP